MAKPEEILIVENEDGEIVREERKDSDCIALYNIMKETLVLLSLLNYDDTEYIMLAKMEQQVWFGSCSWWIRASYVPPIPSVILFNLLCGLWVVFRVWLPLKRRRSY